MPDEPQSATHAEYCLTCTNREERAIKLVVREDQSGRAMVALHPDARTTTCKVVAAILIVQQLGTAPGKF